MPRRNRGSFESGGGLPAAISFFEIVVQLVRLQAEVDAAAAEHRARATYATTASLRLGVGASATLIEVSVFAWIVMRREYGL